MDAPPHSWFAVASVARWAGALLLVLSVTSGVGAQNPPRVSVSRARECNVEVVGVTIRGVPSHVESFGTPSGQHNTFYGGGFVANCAGTDQRIRSDSAEHYGDERRLVLINNVHYTEARVKLDSDRMTYHTSEERLVAEGNVKGLTKNGTRFSGPRAEYLRAIPRVRERSRLTADSRPNVWLSPLDAGTSTKDTTNLQADLVITDNDSLVYAKGRVVIDRPDLSSTSDSAFMDNAREFVRLTYAPRIVGRGERKYTLEGDVIDIQSKQKKVERVRSGGHARGTGEDVFMSADTIDLRMADEKLARAYAWGPSRARAKAKGQDLTADSIDIRMPGQILREMRALRNARAESTPDSTKMVSKTPDWLRGDTVTAYFDSVAKADSAKRPPIREIIAVGSTRNLAGSWYQVAAASGNRNDKPNVNYVLGRRITVNFLDGEVNSVSVKGQAEGFYVEALPDSAKSRASADSALRKTVPRKPQERP